MTFMTSSTSPNLRSFLIACLIATGAVLLLPVLGVAEEPDAPVVERSFKFEYGGTVIGVEPGANIRVWFPIPSDNPSQSVRLVNAAVPAKMTIQTDPDYQNRIGYFETQANEAGQVAFQADFHVNRRLSETHGDEAANDAIDPRYLLANERVPVSGKPLTLIENETMPESKLETGRKLYDVVYRHMSYDKSKPGYGLGDSNWACDSRTGNCTDFHSLFISLARSQKIPARFEIGFSIPPGVERGPIGGYHCWAWFNDGTKGWVPVDISEADKHPDMKEFYFGHLTADRITFSTGRDIELVPASAVGRVNYFVYPHVEVDGEVWPKEKISLRFFHAPLPGNHQ